MNAQFQTGFQRMEQALQRLTDTISAYNPSITAADELVAADEAVSANLKELVQHQRNHQRIQELKSITEKNDEKLKTHIRSLAELRKEIAAIPSAEGTTATREASVDELLSYAKFLSPTTVPPTLRRKQDVMIRTEPVDPTHAANGIATPADGAQEADAVVKKDTVDEKPEEDQAVPDPNIVWESWPSQGHMLNGALADIQRMFEAGQDPAAVLTEAEKAERTRQQKEEMERQERERQEKLKEKSGVFDNYHAGYADTTVFNPDD